MKALLAGLFVVGALLVGMAPSSVGATNGFSPQGVIPHFPGGRAAVRAAATRPVTPATQCGTITCAAYETGVNGFFQDVAAAAGALDNVYSIDTQYSDTTGSIANAETFGGTYVDPKAFPASACPPAVGGVCLTEAQLVTEIDKDLAAKGWTASSTNLFFILLPGNVNTCFVSDPSKGCFSNAFCAYHDSSGSLYYAVEPFQASVGCYAAGAGQGLPNGTEIDESINTISHEQNEAMTDPNQDPNLGGWYTDSGGDEIGDLCAWSFGTPLGTTPGGQPYNQVINGHDYSLQLEYSNANGGCEQYLGGPATPVTSQSSGPLTYHGGPVLRSSTVYTIYWIPKPAMTKAPKVTGTAKVGNALSVSTGTWKYVPAGYAYQWLRCSSSGTSCKAIGGAQSSTYQLVSADAGHRLETKVIASNDSGSTTAASSNKSAIVKK